MKTTAENLDQAEIERFNRIAREWWDPQGPMAALHHINPPRVTYIERCAGGLRGKQVVDVGCGGGLLSEALATRGAQVTGIDMADDVLAAARAHASEQKLAIDYRRIAVEELAHEQAGRFDLVCCLEMLEHVPEPDRVIAACARLAAPGATLVFSTINRNPKAFALAVIGAEYVLNIVPRGTHQYEKFIRPSELDAWVRAAGLEVLGMKGLRYNPLTRIGTMCEDVDVNYFMHCRKPA
jgi:2-polyprenyl-6-hydroxyphenyl methylase / 3-demethylubiquinone-9 3-methyltransferase